MNGNEKSNLSTYRSVKHKKTKSTNLTEKLLFEENREDTGRGFQRGDCQRSDT